MEHRWGSRVPTDVAVRLMLPLGAIGAGRVRNVSVTGAYIESRLCLPLLSLVQIEPVLPQGTPGGSTRRISACVVRHGRGGVGLEWCDMTAAAVEALLHSPSGLIEPDSHSQSAAPLRQSG